MSRTQGDFNFSGNFEVKKEGFIDARTYVPLYANLLEFSASDYMPHGFIVACGGLDDSTKRGIYQCINKNDLSNPLSWEKIGKDVDLSNYYNKSQVDTALNNKVSKFETWLSDLTVEGNIYNNGNFYNIGESSFSDGRVTIDAYGNVYVLDDAGNATTYFDNTGSANFVGGKMRIDTTGKVSFASTPLSNNSILKLNSTGDLTSATAGVDYSAPISLTTTGNSGAATLASDILNIPLYTLSGLGGVPSTRTVAGFPLSSNISLASLTATDNTLTFSGSYDGSVARTLGLNLSNPNIWTGQQKFLTNNVLIGSSTDASNGVLQVTGDIYNNGNINTNRITVNPQAFYGSSDITQINSLLSSFKIASISNAEDGGILSWGINTTGGYSSGKVNVRQSNLTSNSLYIGPRINLQNYRIDTNKNFQLNNAGDELGALTFYGRDNTNSNGRVGGGINVVTTDGTNTFLNFDASALIGNFSNITPKMALSSSGNLIISSTPNIDAGYKLDVNGTSRFQGNMIVSGNLINPINFNHVLYNTLDQTTNFELGKISWNSSRFMISTERGGTGVSTRSIYIVAGFGGGSLPSLEIGGASAYVTVGGSGQANGLNVGHGLNVSSTSQYALGVTSTINATGTGNYRALYISPYLQTNTTTGNKLLADIGYNTASGSAIGTHTSYFNIDSSGVSSFNGNVSIGGASPTQALCVTGSGLFSSALYAPGLQNSSNNQNSQVNTASTGTTILRNIGDTNPALIVRQQNASSTGDIQQWINNSTTVAKVSQSGVFSFSKVQLLALNTAPTSSTDTGTTGEIRVTSDYIYVATSTNTWKRAALTTF